MEHGAALLPFELEWPGSHLADRDLPGARAVSSLLTQLVECVDVCAAALQLDALSDDLLLIDAQRQLDDDTARRADDVVAMDGRRGGCGERGDGADDRAARRLRWTAGSLPSAHAAALGTIAQHSVVAVLATVDVVLDRLCARHPTAELDSIRSRYTARLPELRGDPVRVVTLAAVRTVAQETLDAFPWQGARRAHPS